MLTDLVLGLCMTVAGATQCNNPSPFPRPTDSSELHVTIGSVRVNSPPVVDFTVVNEKGEAVVLTQDDITSGALRFGIAKLVPGTNGNPDTWQSYINTTEKANPTVGPNGAAVLASATQATLESRTTGGTLTRKGDGSYSYQFKTDITKPEQTMGVVYDPALTHRLAIQMSFTDKNGERIAINPIFDFVPKGGPVTLSKRVVHKDACNECHHKLALHGGGRVETEMCVVCHNPGTTDANSGNVLDLGVMVHKIHMGAELDKPYVIYGNSGTKYDFSTVGYPQDQRNCAKCHSADKALTPEGDNWKLRPNKAACGSCHDKVDFNNHPDNGIVQRDNSMCGQCHVPHSSKLDFAIENAHTNPIEVIAKQFKFNILGVSYIAGNRQITIDFSVTDPTHNDQAYDIQKHAAFTAGGGASRVGVMVAWDTAEYHNTGAPGAPGQPITLNPLFGGSTNMGGNRFRMTATLPAEASGTGTVAIDGHPVVNGVRIPVPNVVQDFVITGTLQARREIVSIDKCNVCHANLSLHGNNRQGTTKVCVICHNPDATDIAQRPATLDANKDGIPDNFNVTGVDGKREQSIHFKTMIHSIHAGDSDKHGFKKDGIVVYGYGRSVNDFSHMRYPGTLSACDACHVGDSFRVNAPTGSLGTSIQTASADLNGNKVAIQNALDNPADDIKISREASTCYSCHDQDNAVQHMRFVGHGDIGTEAYLERSVFEDCGGCHGPSEFKDVAKVHKLLHP